MAVKFQVKEPVGGVRVSRVPRVDRLIVVQVLVGLRAGDADRPIDLHDPKALVIDLIELDLVVVADDDARNVLLARLPLVVLERADVARASEILLMLRVAIIKVFTLVLVVIARHIGDVLVYVIVEFDMLGWGNRW